MITPTNGMRNSDIQNGIDHLFSSILFAQSSFNKIKEPDDDKKELLDQRIKSFNKARGRDVVYQYLSSGRGHGPFTELIDGSVKYDLIGGIGINLLGHSHPIIVKSILEAATSDTLMCGNLMPYQDSLELSETLIASVKNSHLKHFWFTCSGSMANDTALKLIWQKKAPASKIIAFSNNFAGRSVATQEITENPDYRQDMPHFIDVEFAPHFNQKNPASSLSNTLNALEAIWNKDPNNYAAITFEIIQGEGGFIFGTPEFYQGICQWAKSKKIFVWVDEVQSFARTQELFAFQMMKLDQYIDVVVVGKALQACGLLYTEELNPKPGLIAGTFHGSIPSLKAANATVKFLTSGSFYGPEGRMAQLEKKFLSKINQLAETSCKGKISFSCAVGTMIAFELGDASKEVTMKFLKKLLENGVVAFSAGKKPMRVRMLIPITLTDEHINEIFSIVEKTILETV
ncbi:MAG: aminotransferase class III-fold pyridoxal phosphate-dependent enzyme [Bacteriovoracaceae bacterium]